MRQYKKIIIKDKAGNELLAGDFIDVKHACEFSVHSFLSLKGADLRGADLCGAILQRVDLAEADLTGADLRYAHLMSANLNGAVLENANVYAANLYCANLTDSSIQQADWSAARREFSALVEETPRVLDQLHDWLKEKDPSKRNMPGLHETPPVIDWRGKHGILAMLNSIRAITQPKIECMLRRWLKEEQQARAQRNDNGGVIVINSTVTMRFVADEGKSEQEVDEIAQRLKDQLTTIMEYADSVGILSNEEPVYVEDWSCKSTIVEPPSAIEVAEGEPSMVDCLALQHLCHITGTHPHDWSTADGPSSGCGEDYYFSNNSGDCVWWINVDQGEVVHANLM